MIALIMAASLLGSVILICVCAPLAPLLLLLRRRRMSLRKMLPSALSMSSRSAARRLKKKASYRTACRALKRRLLRNQKPPFSGKSLSRPYT